MNTEWVPVEDLTDELLFVLIAEEAGEIVQASAKIQRFGLDGYNPYLKEKTNNNYIDLKEEYLDLRELILELGRRRDDDIEQEAGKKLRLVARSMLRGAR